MRGRLANSSFENQRIKTTLFFAGQARDGSNPYGCNPDPNLSLYMVYPIDDRDLNWSVSPEIRDYVLTRMVDAGINVVTMSSWGERFLPCNVGWAQEAPMQTAPDAQDELFAATIGKGLLIMPLIESRADWAFCDEFPRWTDGRVAPGTCSQISDLINRYLRDPKLPDWAGQWARVYDRHDEARIPVVIIHAGSNRLGPNDHRAFAEGFDLVAEVVFNATGVKVGFFLDVLPPNTNAPGNFKPSPELTGPFLRDTDAVLGIQCFIPEVWLGQASDVQLIQWKRTFSGDWFNTGIPLLMDVSAGYDNHLVFPQNQSAFGYHKLWRDALTNMVADFGGNGIVFNSWNGYTEGMAAVPTREHCDFLYRWLQTLG